MLVFNMGPLQVDGSSLPWNVGQRAPGNCACLCVSCGRSLCCMCSGKAVSCSSLCLILSQTFARSLALALSRSLDNGFIPESLLEDVMKALDLVSEPE